ncbi:YbhB/YbcL family Raf kinase inhibitor-like protein [Flavihumibacter fluvii]|uniref:YbhB/YbcL family Raf kinase inhibitor-like protein n=1 Tax=Flavihumibacter fluvii TaxID=2838157 RepID=UPI001BDE8AA6|nr:YbhB/YbcL family Raf kinase inhibitor-like protein [Flavihumibacter fluvii]ULQ53315.1 YbhB/YbcL family Raf kinase inhibitor-like protein [Flavihumibacter fluvii]
MKFPNRAKAPDIATLELSSAAFIPGGSIPAKHTCDGKNSSPPLAVKSFPPATKCLALITDDPDAPGGTWVHWVAWNIPVTHHLKENECHGIEGMNDFRQSGYGGPCPPSGTHHYHFKVYALDDLLDIPTSAGKPELEKAMNGHIIGFGEIIGLYKRS